MKYFIDTEFIEGFKKPLFGKRRHFIDLISIGIVAEDGREYYAISNEFNRNDADDWVKENVIDKLEQKATSFYDSPRLKENSRLYKSNRQIVQEVFHFCTNDGLSIEKAKYYNVIHEEIEFYAYYADYDWVVFCSLFGRMIDLPSGFPMYCKDLKQSLDAYNEKVWFPDSKKFMQGTDTVVTKELALEKLKTVDDYPKQTKEHNALDDAKWNFQLYKFLNRHYSFYL